MLEKIFSRESLVPPEQLPPLVLAHVGDAVYELYIRTRLLNKSRTTAHKMHLEVVRYVKAQAQAQALQAIQPLLSEEEERIVRRGRNAKPGHVPKHASVIDYRRSSAFEALVGYLYLKGQDQRLKEILEKAESVLD